VWSEAQVPALARDCKVGETLQTVTIFSEALDRVKMEPGLATLLMLLAYHLGLRCVSEEKNQYRLCNLMSLGSESQLSPW
jgi:hypothetical protein